MFNIFTQVLGKFGSRVSFSCGGSRDSPATLLLLRRGSCHLFYEMYLFAHEHLTCINGIITEALELF